MEEQERKHHFLFYIFQFDKKRCMMEESKFHLIQQLLHMFAQGDVRHGKREIDLPGPQSPGR